MYRDSGARQRSRRYLDSHLLIITILAYIISLIASAVYQIIYLGFFWEIYNTSRLQNHRNAERTLRNFSRIHISSFDKLAFWRGKYYVVAHDMKWGVGDRRGMGNSVMGTCWKERNRMSSIPLKSNWFALEENLYLFTDRAEEAPRNMLLAIPLEYATLHLSFSTTKNIWKDMWKLFSWRKSCNQKFYAFFQAT